jgi:hypothetical protein
MLIFISDLFSLQRWEINALLPAQATHPFFLSWRGWGERGSPFAF